MKIFRILSVLAVLALMISLLPGAALPVSADNRSEQIAEDALYMPGEVVIGFAEGQTPEQSAAQAQALAGEVGAQVAEVLPGAAVLRFAPDADVPALAEQLSSMMGVVYAEPAWVYKNPEPVQVQERPEIPYIIREMPGTDKKFAIAIETLKAMKTRSGSRILATFPNDPQVWENPAWTESNANIVWNNSTPSRNVCVIDTGVDYLHPDLAGKIIRGYDFVWGDTDPMDDHGHGTFVAGIIVANQNNKRGAAGIAPNAKVVAVKALNAQGMGTNYDIAQSIYYCANRTDIHVINLSLGGPYSSVVKDAVDYATNTKNKILVAAAGNSNTKSYCGRWNDKGTPDNYLDDEWEYDNTTDARLYPAGFAVAHSEETCNYPNWPSPGVYTFNIPAHDAYRVLSVGSVGTKEDWGYNRWSKSVFSNYGNWVTFVAPGYKIFSTRPRGAFYGQQQWGVTPLYGFGSGTSFAAPVVAAVAARAWGYKPTFTADQVVQWVKDNSDINFGADNNWPDNQDRFQANVAKVLERGALSVEILDAATGLPLNNAIFYAYQGTALKGSAINYKNIEYHEITNEKIIVPSAWAEIINLPAGWYTPKVMAAGYTASPTNAFVPWGDKNTDMEVYSGWWNSGTAGLTPRSSNISVVVTWPWVVVTWPWQRDDFDQIVYLPTLPKVTDDGQPSIYAVSSAWGSGHIGNVADVTPYPQGTGSLTVFPFARHMSESYPHLRSEASIIRSRPVNAALPYYTGVYEVRLTDYGQFYDANGDGVETPGGSCDDKTGDCNILSFYGANAPLGVNQLLSVFIWKDGQLKLRVNLSDNCALNEHVWKAATITSGLSGMPVYTPVDECTTEMDVPSGYPALDLPSIPLEPWW